MSKPVDLTAARKDRKDREYRSLVLGAFGHLEHAAKRELVDRRAAVERAARDKL